MHVAGVCPVREDILPAVDRLQQQEVRDLRDAGLARLGHAGRQRLAALVQHAGHFGDQAGQRHGGRADQRGRDPSFVQHDAVFGGHLGDAGQADAEVAGALLGFQQVAHVQPADLQFRGLGRGGLGVVGLEQTGM